MKWLFSAILLITSIQVNAEDITVNVGDARPGMTTDINIFLGNKLPKDLAGFQMSLYLPDDIILMEEEDIKVCFIEEYEDESYEYWDSDSEDMIKIKKKMDGGFLILGYCNKDSYYGILPRGFKLFVKLPYEVSDNETRICSLSNIALCTYKDKNDWQREYETLEIDDISFEINLDTDSPQLYSALSDGTLTLYYDNQINVHSKNSDIHLLGGYRWIYFGALLDNLYLPYIGPTTDKPEEVRTVVFDESMANVQPTTLSKWFEGFSSLKEIKGLEYLNTSEVTNMRKMFAGCSSLKEIDISHFDFSNISSSYDWFECEFPGIDYLFADCSSLERINLKNLDTSNLVSLEGLFMNCSSLKEIDVSHFDTSNAIYMYNMFAGCSSLTSIDVSHFDTSNVGYFDEMFEGCSSLESLDLSHFDTSSSKSMGRMFAGCSSLNSIDVSHFSVSGCTTDWAIPSQPGGAPYRWKDGSGFYQMFKDCNSLEQISLFALESETTEDDFNEDIDGSLIIPVQYTAEEMFAGCTSLKEIDLSHFNGNGCSNDRMFAGCSSLRNINLHHLNPYIIGEEMFDGCGSLASIGIPVSVEIIADHAFQGCTSLNTVKCDIPTPLAISEETFDHYVGCTLVVPAPAVNDYQSADVWKNFSSIISSRKGDANGDNEVDITDVLVIVDYVLGRINSNFIFSNADLDNNGTVEITDALEVVDILLGRPQLQ